MSPHIRLMIVDQEATRVGISMALANDRRLQVCAEAGDAAHAIAAAEREQPDICLVSSAVDREPVRLVDAICRVAPDTAVVVLAEVPTEAVLDYIRAGAVGYVPGALDAWALRRVLLAVLAGEAALPGTAVRMLLREVRGRGAGASRLTPRESEVFALLQRGLGTAIIADRMGISQVTARRHISELMRKLRVQTRSELLA